MDCYVGLDVSLRSVAVCVIDATGKHVVARSLGCEIADIEIWTPPETPTAARAVVIHWL